MSTYGSIRDDVEAYLGEYVDDFDVDAIVSDIRGAGIADIDDMDPDDFQGTVQAHDTSGKPSSIAALRADAGMTQVELARRVGVSQSQIADWERGAHVPSARSIARLAGALGVPAADVLASVIAYSLQETERDGY